MADAKRDSNQVTTLLALSSSDGTTPVPLYADPTTHRLLVSSAAGALSTLSDVTLTSVAQGDILYYNGTKWVNLAHGTSGQFLQTQGASANPIWATATAGAGGSNTQVQYNSSGSLAGAAGFIFDGTSKVTLGVAGASVGAVAFANATSGSITLQAVTGALGSVTLSLPAATDTLVGKATTDTFTNKTLDTAGTGNVLKINGTQVSAVTGSGSVVLGTSPTIATPTITTSATVPLIIGGSGTTGTQLTLKTTTGVGTTDALVIVGGNNGATTFATFSSGALSLGTTAAFTTGTIELGAASDTTIARVSAGKISVEGVDVVTVSSTDTLTNKTYDTAGAGNVLKINGTQVSAVTGTGSVVLASSPTLTTPTLGVASATTINKVTLTAPATGSTLTIADGKTLTASNSITLAGTDSTTMTFPASSATLGGLGIAQTWTAQNKFNNIVDVNNAITASANAATVPVTYRLNTVTNNSAATLTITMTTTSAVDGQMTVVRILDASAVAQTITWVNTENSTVSAPTTSNGSTTLPLTVGFMYNSATSKWRCIAYA